MAVAIDKISTMTLPNYSGLGVAIEGLTAKQAALVLLTRNLSQAELEEIVSKTLIDEAVKRGILTKEKAAEILSTYGVVTADNVEIGSKKGLTTAIKGLIKDKLKLSKLDVSAIGGVTALITVLYQFSKGLKKLGTKHKN